MRELDEVGELYQEIILDHCKNPRNGKVLEEAQIEARGYNPFCGDEVAIQLKLRDGNVEEVGFQGRGCSISQASGSMLSELLRGKTLEDAERLTEVFRKLMRGEEFTEEELQELGDLSALSGVRKYPIRIKCALLAWTALEEGIERSRSEGG